MYVINGMLVIYQYKEAKERRNLLKLIGMTLPNQRWRRSKKKLPTFASWPWKTVMRYLFYLNTLVMTFVMILVIMMMSLMIIKNLMMKAP